jgi:hypothetical protein
MLDWDRSHDWVLQHFWTDQTRVTICFRQGAPSLGELVALRRCLPEYRDVPPADLKAMIGDTGSLPLDILPTPDARRLIDAARGQGLEVVAESASFVSYIPFDRTTGCAWLIEADAEREAVARSMLEAGIPVQEVQA